jgi:ubiquinone biosynthesis protein
MFFPRRTRRIRRYRQITRVLMRHGMGYLIGIVGLERFAPFRRGMTVGGGWPSQPERLRRALEELGPTFVKLGQILSTRADLLPPDFQRELAQLQDSAAPVPFPQIDTVLEEQLGMPIHQAFAQFDREPLASASIGQVHAAKLNDGTDVVVKVQRPGVHPQIEEDLDILQNLAQTASKRWEVANHYDVIGLVQEFSDTLRNELDYLREARNAERFAEGFADDPDVRIPIIFRETTTSQVITMERLHGMKVSDSDRLEEVDVDTSDLADRLFQMYLKMIFYHGFFHADPHAGNFFIDSQGRIGLIDFGMVGHVDQRMQDDLVRLTLSTVMEDPDRMVDVILDLGVARSRVDRAILRQDLQRLLNRYSGRSLAEIELGQAIEDGMMIVRRHNLQLPTNMALLMKTGVMAEGLAARVSPDFEPIMALRPYLDQILMNQLQPAALARRVGTSAFEAVHLGLEMPHMLRRILSAVDRGQLEVGVRPERFESLMHRAERMVNRVVLGIITASFIIGLAILMAVYNPPLWDQWAGPLFGVGFLLAVGMGFYLAWSILRSPR